MSPLRMDSNLLQPRTLRDSDLGLKKQLRKRRKYAIGIVTATGLILSFLIVASITVPVASSGLDGLDDCDTSSQSFFRKFFKLNMPVFRGMGFSEAKFLDVIIDLVLGQGGRALHGWVAYVLPVSSPLAVLVFMYTC